jgi:hypothetical protein
MYTGGITTGAISDLLDARAVSCVIMMYLAVPTVREALLYACACRHVAYMYMYFHITLQ